ncbi:MAG: fatty acid desaturase [Gemmataceae bacterium]
MNVASKHSAVPPTLELPSGATRGRIFWEYLVVIAGFHLIMPLAFLPGLFSWWYLLLLIPGNYFFGSLGINLAYHRLLTHRSLEVPRWLEYLLTLLGVCSLQGSPIRWVTVHRMHHQHSDEQEDPHSPFVTFLWGHMNWLFTVNSQLEKLSTYERYAPDLLEDPFQRWLHRRYMWLTIYIVHAVLLAGVCYGISYAVAEAAWDAYLLGTGLFLWSVVVRTVYVWHITWLVNSAAHFWGYRNYGTQDHSTNNFVVAFLTNGEGWHNNHHATPRAAAHGHRWWEIDLTYTTIVVMSWVGLAKKVVPIRVPKVLQPGAQPAAVLQMGPQKEAS